MISNLYIQKSFALLGQSLNSCLGCSYCRVSSQRLGSASYHDLPESVNPAFTRLPVAINLFHGDPTLQPATTRSLLCRLEDHEGPVVIVVKGDVFSLDLESCDLPRHFHLALSTFGVDSFIDGGTRSQFERNLREAEKIGGSFSIEFRPVVCGVNDTPKTFEYVLSQAQRYGCSVAFSGLQVLDNSKHLPMYPGAKPGPQKTLPPDVENRFREMARKMYVPVFRKTSCAISYELATGRDYNAHYYRPNEMRCASCDYRNMCKRAHVEEKPNAFTALPYGHRVEWRVLHECSMRATCQQPTHDCSHMRGHVVVTSTPLSSADVRVTKWLTGCAVSTPSMHDSPFLSDFWRTLG